MLLIVIFYWIKPWTNERASGVTLKLILEKKLFSLFRVLFKTDKTSGVISESFVILEDRQIT